MLVRAAMRKRLRVSMPQWQPVGPKPMQPEAVVDARAGLQPDGGLRAGASGGASPHRNRRRVMLLLKCSARGADGVMETCFHKEA